MPAIKIYFLSLYLLIHNLFLGRCVMKMNQKFYTLQIFAIASYGYFSPYNKFLSNDKMVQFWKKEFESTGFFTIFSVPYE